MGNYRIEPIAIIATENQFELELFFHDAFDDKRTDYRRHGKGQRHEWFKLTEQDVGSFCRLGAMFGNLTHLNGNWSLEQINV